MKTPRICIYGAGAIGGFIGARLAATGRCDVSAVARGATLAALKARGFRVRSGGIETSAPARASDDPRELGEQDLVVIAVKGPAMAAVAERIAPLLGPHTAVLPAMNGVPWWFTDGLAAPAGGEPLASVDPEGRIAAALPARRVLGCVVHLAATTPEPGLVDHKTGQGLILGEAVADAADAERLPAVAAMLEAAGFEVTRSTHIRRDVWYKLWGNLTMNPVSAITGATADRVLDDPLVRKLCTDAMDEAGIVGERIGCAVPQTPAQRHEITRTLGAFKTSMLQDVEAGRAIELDAIVGAVRELGARVGVATPTIDAIYGLARLFGQVRGLYPAAA